MQLFLLMTLVSSFAIFDVTNGDETMRPGRLIEDASSNENKGVSDFEWEGDEELDDEAAKYRWMAPLLYDELKERKLKSSNISEIWAGSEDEEEEEQKKKKKPKSEGKGEKKKGKKKNKKNKNKAPKRKFKEEGNIYK